MVQTAHYPPALGTEAVGGGLKEPSVFRSIKTGLISGKWVTCRDRIRVKWSCSDRLAYSTVYGLTELEDLTQAWFRF